MPADSSPKFTVIADASFLWLLAVHIRDNFEGGKVRVVLCVKWGGSSEEAVRVGGGGMREVLSTCSSDNLFCKGKSDGYFF